MTSSTKRMRPELEIQARYALLAPLSEGRRVLDFGSDAQSLLVLAEAGATEITAVSDAPDDVRASLEQAGVEGVDVLSATLPLPFADASFELVMCHDLGERMHGDPGWLPELRRVLVPEGYLVVALPNPEGVCLSDLLGERFDAALTYEQALAMLGDRFGHRKVTYVASLVSALGCLLLLWAVQPWLNRLAYWHGVLAVDVLAAAVTLVTSKVNLEIRLPVA